MAKASKAISRELDMVLLLEPSHVDRMSIDIDKITELAKSISEIGLLQSILVRPVKNKFEIVAGHRRYLAHKQLGKTVIEATVREMTDKQAALARASENLTREDLTPIEEAKIYSNLIEHEGLTEQEVAKKMGKTGGTIKRRMMLLRMPECLQNATHKKQISMTVAEELWPIADLTDLEYYLSFAIENGCTKETARGWCKDWKDSKRREKTAGGGGEQFVGIQEARPVYVPCDLCDSPFQIGEETVLRVCKTCYSTIKTNM